MPKERRFYLERSEIKSSNKFYKSREKNKELIIPLDRKSTSVLSIKPKDGKPPSLRRKDLKSLSYIHNNITEDNKPLGLKSCLSSQKQCDKIKMKVKFYLKKDNKLGHDARTKSAHSLNKKNTKSVDFDSTSPLHKTMIKSNKKHMAGDSNCMKIDVNQKKLKHMEKVEHKTYANSSSLKRNLVRTMKNMIIEKSKQLSDTSLRHQGKSYKIKDTDSYSSITKYQKFKSRLNKTTMKSQSLYKDAAKPVENTSSRRILHNEKYQMTPVKHEDLLGGLYCKSAANKVHSISGNSDHLNKNVKQFRELGKNVTKLDANNMKSNLSAVFYQDICVTGKKLKLWKNDYTKRRPISLQIGRKQTSPSHVSENNKPSSLNLKNKIKKVQTFCGHEEATGKNFRKSNLISLDSFTYPDNLIKECFRNKKRKSFSNTPSTVIRLSQCFSKDKVSKGDHFSHTEKPRAKRKKSIHFNEDIKYVKPNQKPKHKPNHKPKTPPKVILRPAQRELWDDLLDSSNRARNQDEDIFQKFTYQKERPLVIKDTIENLPIKKKKKIVWSDSYVEPSKSEGRGTSRRSRSTLAIQNKLSDKISRIFNKISPRKNKSLPKIKLQTKPIKGNLATSVSKECNTANDSNKIKKESKNNKKDEECACSIHNENNHDIRQTNGNTTDLNLAENKKGFVDEKICEGETSKSLEKALHKHHSKAINRCPHYNEFITNKIGEWTQTIPITEKRNAQTEFQTSNSIQNCDKSQICLSRNTSFISSKYFDENQNKITIDHQDISVGSNYSNKELRLNPNKIDYKIIKYRKSSTNEQPQIKSKQATILHDISNKVEKSNSKSSNISTVCKKRSNFATASIECVDASKVRKQYSNSTNFPEKYFPKTYSHSNNSLNDPKGRRVSDKLNQNNKEQKDNVGKINYRELPFDSHETKFHEIEQNYNHEDNRFQDNTVDRNKTNEAKSLREKMSEELANICNEGSQKSILEQHYLKRQGSCIRQYHVLPEIYADRSTTMIKNQNTDPIRETMNIKTANAPTTTAKSYELLSKITNIPSNESRYPMKTNKVEKKNSIENLQSNIKRYKNLATKELSPRNSTIRSSQRLEVEQSSITLKEEFLEEKSLQTRSPGVSIKVPPVKLKFSRVNQNKSPSTIKKFWYRFLESPKPSEKLPLSKIENLQLTNDKKTPQDSLSKQRKQDIRVLKRNKNTKDASSEMIPIRSNYQIKIQNVIAQQSISIPANKTHSSSVKKPIGSHTEIDKSIIRKHKSEYTALRRNKPFDKTNKRTDTSRLNIKKKTKSSQHEHTTVVNKLLSMLVVKRKRMDKNRQKVKQLEKNNLEKDRSKDILTEKKQEQPKSTTAITNQKMPTLPGNETNSSNGLKNSHFHVYNEAKYIPESIKPKRSKEKHASKFKSEITINRSTNNWAQKIGNLISAVLPKKTQTGKKSKRTLPQRRKEQVEVRAIQTRLERQRKSEDKSTCSSKKFGPNKLQYIAPSQIISEIRNVDTRMKRFCISPNTNLKNIEPLIRSINPNKVQVEIKDNRKELVFINDKNKQRKVGNHPCACSLHSNKNINKFTAPHAMDKWILPDCPPAETPTKVKLWTAEDETETLSKKSSEKCLAHTDCACLKRRPQRPPQGPGRLHLSNRPPESHRRRRKSLICDCKNKSPNQPLVSKSGNKCLCSLRHVCECFDKPLNALKKKTKIGDKKKSKVPKKKEKEKQKKKQIQKKKEKKPKKPKKAKKAKKAKKTKNKKKTKKKKKTRKLNLSRKRKRGLMVRINSTTRHLAKYGGNLKCDGLFIRTLRKQPCLIVYKIFPYAYPHMLTLMVTFKHIFRVTLFTIAFITWIPWMLLLYLFKIMVCNC